MPGTMLVPLTRGYFAVIDEADAEFVANRNWRAQVLPRKVYAVTGSRAKQVYLHRALWDRWGFATCSELDHVNTDGLDNRRANLRAATHAENARNRPALANNTSGFKGVSWVSRLRKWRASIWADGRPIHLGVFSAPEDAHAAYARAARELHGEFARVA